MERSLHRQLKEFYGPEVGGRTEVVLEGYRIDAIGPDDRLIEIQSGPLRLLKAKLARLLPTRKVSVIKPVIVGRRLIRRDQPDGANLTARRSPKRGVLIDIFEELVGLAPLFPHVNLRIDLLAVEIDEIRVLRRRRPGYQVVDRVLNEVVSYVRLSQATDLWSLLPVDLAASRFTTRDLASRLGRPLAFAQRVAYCLYQSGAVEVVAKIGQHRVYVRNLVVNETATPDQP